MAGYILKHRASAIIETFNQVRADEVKQAKIQKQISDMALSETNVKAIQRNSQQGGDHKNSHGEWYHQGPEEELQVMRAQAEPERIALMDRTNASGILKEGHDAARRFNGKDPVVVDQPPVNFEHLRTKLSPANEAKFQ